MTGDERFLLDSFVDDIVSGDSSGNGRYVELNTDIIPRGHLTMTGFNIKSDEFANPNVWLRMVVENEVEIRKVLTRVRAVPITVNYDLTIMLSSEIDTFKCSQSILETIWIYKFMYFEHNFMNIDAVMIMPDTNSIEMSRDKNLTSDNSIKLKCSFTVETYYPAFRRDRIVDTGYPREYGSGMKDSNGFELTGGYSDYFNGKPSERPPLVSTLMKGTMRTPGGVPTDNTGVTIDNNNGVTIDNKNPWIEGPHNPDNPQVPYGEKGNFYNVGSVTNASDVTGTFAQDGYAVFPKKTRWFNNILRARERAGGSQVDPVQGQQNVTPRRDEEK
jgi:hypothetical protein